MKAISSIYSSLEIPLLLVFVGGFIVLLFKNKKIGLAILFGIFVGLTWRIAVKASSERYYAFILLPAIIISSWFFMKISQKKIAKIIIAAVLFLQLISIFDSFRNVYILDAKETLHGITDKAPYSTFLITTREYNRLRIHRSNSFIKYRFFETDINSLSDQQTALKKFSKWETPLYLIYYNRKQGNVFTDGFSDNQTSKIASFITGKKHNKQLVFHERKSVPGNPAIPDNSPNRIKNGDLESLVAQPTIRKRFAKWIADGEEFYDDEGLLLPLNYNLSTHWVESTPRGIYPHFYSEQNGPIDGSSSLHCVFPKIITTDRFYSVPRLYFLDKVPSNSGVLTFTVRMIHQDYPMSLKKIDYDDNGKGIKKENDIEYLFWLNDTKNHTFSIPFNKSDFLGSTAMFYIDAQDTEFIIDNIGYYFPEE